MAIETKDIEHLAGLARVAVSDGEKEILKHDLEEILGYVSQIKEFALEALTPAVGELRNVLRADENPHGGGVFTEDLLNSAPRREGNRIFVKKIL